MDRHTGISHDEILITSFTIHNTDAVDGEPSAIIIQHRKTFWTFGDRPGSTSDGVVMVLYRPFQTGLGDISEAITIGIFIQMMYHHIFIYPEREDRFTVRRYDIKKRLTRRVP